MPKNEETSLATRGEIVTSDRDALAILGYQDSEEGRELVEEGKGDLLPYDKPFEVLAELVEVKAKKNYDSRGVYAKLRVVETNAPAVVKVNRTYTLWFFDRNKSLEDFVIGKMVEQRIRFAATIDEYAGDPLERGADGAYKYKSAPILLQMHQTVEPLGLQMRFKNEYQRTTRNGKDIHELHFELV